MKTKTIITSICLAFAMLFSFQIHAQEFSDLDKSPMDAAAFPTSNKNSDKAMKIVYSRPQLKGRSLSKLAPNGEVWRTGANEAAELTLYKTVKFGDQTIAPGTYTFYVIPGENEWTAIINTDINVWGSYFYKSDNDVARLTVTPTKAKESLEAFSIAFDASENGAIMYLGWADVRVPVPFTFE